VARAVAPATGLPYSTHHVLHLFCIYPLQAMTSVPWRFKENPSGMHRVNDTAYCNFPYTPLSENDCAYDEPVVPGPAPRQPV